MKAQEIRIGNYIDRNGLMEVRVISQSGVKIYDHVNNIFPPTFFDFDENIKPIPLTEEWLLKFGCEKAKRGFVIDRFRLTYNEQYEFWYVIDDSTLSYITKVEFVHEWQNVYFVLNGEELEIK